MFTSCFVIVWVGGVVSGLVPWVESGSVLIAGDVKGEAGCEMAELGSDSVISADLPAASLWTGIAGRLSEVIG